MSNHELQTALEALPTSLLQRLADRLEAHPNTIVTVGSWRRCPMTLAGVNHRLISSNGPEHQFANAWDTYATPAATITWRDRLCGRSSKTASRADVRALLRLVNSTLAARCDSEPLADAPVDAGVHAELTVPA